MCAVGYIVQSPLLTQLLLLPAALPARRTPVRPAAAGDVAAPPSRRVRSSARRPLAPPPPTPRRAEIGPSPRATPHPQPCWQQASAGPARCSRRPAAPVVLALLAPHLGGGRRRLLGGLLF